MRTPDVVVVGHVVQDLVPGGWRLGGTATFAAVQAQRLGLRVGIVTRAGRDAELDRRLPEIEIAGRPASRTTAFQNVYQADRRWQQVPSRAEPLDAEDVPEEWRTAPVVLLGPVCGEVPPELSLLFGHSVIGVAAQGWLRRLDRQGRVRRRAWQGASFWSNCRVFFVSDEDLGRRRDQATRWAAEVPVVVVTQYTRGVQVHSEGRRRRMQAFPVEEVDPTGAGDVFSMAFLVRYQETESVEDSTRFASAAAAYSVETVGIEGIASRQDIEKRMRAYPEIVLQ